MYCTGLVCLMRTDPKSSRSGVSTIVPPCVPVPCTLAVSIPPCTFAATVTVPLRCPVAVGANMIEIAHDAAWRQVRRTWAAQNKIAAAHRGRPASARCCRCSGWSGSPPPLVVPTACAGKVQRRRHDRRCRRLRSSALCSPAPPASTPRPFVPARSHFSPLVSTALSVVTRTAGSPAP